jgi:PIN domain nuclease of toxin-antitoxin system
VKLLLDTHAFLYWASGSRKLPRRASSAIARPQTVVAISSATVWEIRIKVARGRLRTDFENVSDEAAKHGFEVLAISGEHAQLAGDLPLHHEDPFDRMLIAQARLIGMTMVSGDQMFEPYAIPLLWD